eukprot:11180934-Lingulodinium_polyedra.AAC.1
MVVARRAAAPGGTVRFGDPPAPTFLGRRGGPRRSRCWTCASDGARRAVQAGFGIQTPAGV